MIWIMIKLFFRQIFYKLKTRFKKDKKSGLSSFTTKHFYCLNQDIEMNIGLDSSKNIQTVKANQIVMVFKKEFIEENKKIKLTFIEVDSINLYNIVFNSEDERFYLTLFEELKLT